MVVLSYEARNYIFKRISAYEQFQPVNKKEINFDEIESHYEINCQLRTDNRFNGVLTN